MSVIRILGDPRPIVQSGAHRAHTTAIIAVRPITRIRIVRSARPTPHRFPAWPANLDVDFKLYVPAANTQPAATVRAVVSKGALTILDVNPPGRRADVVVLQRQ